MDSAIKAIPYQSNFTGRIEMKITNRETFKPNRQTDYVTVVTDDGSCLEITVLWNNKTNTIISAETTNRLYRNHDISDIVEYLRAEYSKGKFK